MSIPAGWDSSRVQSSKCCIGHTRNHVEAHRFAVSRRICALVKVRKLRPEAKCSASFTQEIQQEFTEF